MHKVQWRPYGRYINYCVVPMIVDLVKEDFKNAWRPDIRCYRWGMTSRVKHGIGIRRQRGLGRNVLYTQKKPMLPAHKSSTYGRRGIDDTNFDLLRRPLHVKRNAYVDDFHNRADKIKELCDQGIVPGEWVQSECKEGT